MFEAFKGQERVKAKLAIAIHQGKISSRMPHLGLFAGSGYGKTTLADLIAKELNAGYIYINGTGLKDSITFVSKIYQARKTPEKKHIIFIDEAHSLGGSIQDNLLSILEEPAILCFAASTKMQCARRDGSIKNVKRGESVQIALPDNISFILGTTDRGQLKDTILNRIIELTFDPYTENDIVQILSEVANVNTPDILIRKIASVSRNGRDGKQYLKGIEAFIDMHNIQHPSEEHFEQFCSIYGISHDGLKINELTYLSILMEQGTIGLQNISALMGVKVEEITNIIEPYLFQKGLIAITPKGRELSPTGHKRMGQATDGMLTIQDDL